ncbi:unnamed protein product [Cylindrotheca closterium]|uniref:Uncharacterized protein n=1 Tax=Cylindrotheca closterium TaxID=2856 RepID=A0AAD2JI95_9STRA|nr:unnamed protein product [Cylindrotheca closterium]
MSPKCPNRLLPKIQWKNQDKYVDYGKKLNLSQIGATVPATVPATIPAIVPGASASTSGASSVAGSINTPLQLAHTTGNQMMQVPSGMQLMQIPTQGGSTITVPYSMNANGEIAFSGMQLSRQGFSGAQGKHENGKDVYLIPCPAGTTNVGLQANRHYASEDEDLPDLATEADRGLQFIQSRRKERDPFGLYDHVIMDSDCTNTTICNGELMHGLRHAEKELDMHTNVGSRVLDEEGFLGRFPPPVYHNEDGIANVLAMRKMIAAGYRIIMDTDADNAFIVHCDGNRKMRFVNCKGVYVLEQLGANVEPGAKETSVMYRRQSSNLNNQPHFELSSNKQNGYTGLEMTSKMATVRKNKEGFAPRQVKAAMQARSAIWTDSKNSMEPQSIKAIYIEPTKGQRTGHQVLNLNTKKMISQPKVVVLPVTDQVIQRVEAWAATKGITSMKFFDKKRDLETFQDGDQIAGVDDTEQGYLEEAFDQDYEPEDEDECDFNLCGQFDDINDSKREELLADADNDVDDMPELTVRFQGDDDYESDDDSGDDLCGQFDDINDSEREELLEDADNDVDDMPELTVRFCGDDDFESDDDLGDEGNEEEEPIVANFDHHQENVDRGTDDIGSLVTDLEDLQETPEEEIVFEPEEPQVAKVTRSGQTYVQAAMSGLNLSQVPKKPREWPSSRSGSSDNKNKNRAATRPKHRERELKPLKNKLKSGIHTKEGSRSTKDSKAILEAKHNLCFQQIGNEMKADYGEHNTILIARCMMQIKAKFDTGKGLCWIY